MNKRKILNSIFVVALWAVLIGSFYSNFIKTRVAKGDFCALYENSRHAMAVRSLADPESLGYYPPSARPILMIFAVLPLRIAAVVWWVIAVGLHGLCIYLLAAHLLPVKYADWSKLFVLCTLAILPWLSADLAGGNISPLILASFVLSYFLYRKKYLWLSGLTLGVGIAVKFLPVFLISFYAVKRQWKMFAISIFCTLVIGIVPGVLLFGHGDYLQSWKTWLDNAMNRRTAKYMIVDGSGISYVNQSLANVLLHTLSPFNARHDDE